MWYPENIIMKHKSPYKILKVVGNGHIGFLKEYIGYYCLVIPLKIKTSEEGHKLRSACIQRTEYCQFAFMGQNCRIYTNGLTEHIKPIIPLIKNRIFNDCIKNPRKYLK
ncbi:hypothetical protein LCGC14_2317620 [marine sediment metagenome]|uniref:Uncharacterized protein n=1 Tax=marine sediment metagenome TaxID=412755 RepID=A0A0F9D690_9ZZZZ